MGRLNGRVIGAWCVAAGSLGMAVCVIFRQPKYGLISIVTGIVLGLVTRLIFRGE
ncbi:MAG: hypothetical protein IKF51_03070 [Solobacterium sp.]|nr:hypothetical protein [Solobacterium sp.]